jgi:hypothetical protein
MPNKPLNSKDKKIRVKLGDAVSKGDIDIVTFINIFQTAAQRLNMDLSRLDLSKMLKGRDINELLPFDAGSRRRSLIFKVVTWNYYPLLDLLKKHGMRFD